MRNRKKRGGEVEEFGNDGTNPEERERERELV